MKQRSCEATDMLKLSSPSGPSRGRSLGQDPRRRVAVKIELAIVSETKATIANARMTTTTATLLRQQIYKQVGFQTQLLYYQ
jgi:hypothetical protein